MINLREISCLRIKIPQNIQIMGLMAHNLLMVVHEIHPEILRFERNMEKYVQFITKMGIILIKYAI